MDRQLKLDAPIKRWDEAIPMGNGKIGGLLYGGEDSKLRISLDRGDLWDEQMEEKPAGFNWRNWCDLLEEKNFAQIDEIFTKPYDQKTPTKIPCGGLELELDKKLNIKTFYLDCQRAISHVYEEGDQECLQCFFAAEENVAVIKMVGQPVLDWKLTFPSVLQEELGYSDPELASSGEFCHYTQTIPDGNRFSIVAQKVIYQNDTYIYLTICNSVTDGSEDPLLTAKTALGAYIAQGYQTVLEKHLTWWEKYWSVSRIQLPQSDIQEHYDLCRYFLGAGSRKGEIAMPLQAVWTNDDGLPQWKGDYHHDLNTQMIYVSYLVAGHMEEGQVFLDYMFSLLPNFRKFAQDFYEAPGAMIPIVMTAEGKALGGWPQYSLNPQGSAGWVAWMFYRHWQFTRDNDFLREKAYPFCAEIAECINALLQPSQDGVLRMPISSSPEMFSNRPQCYLKPTSNYDYEGMSVLFNSLHQMALELGEAAEATRWLEVSQQLGSRHIDQDAGDLLVAPDTPFACSHRHLSHLMAIHPFSQISVEGGEQERSIIEKSIETFEKIGYSEWTGYTHTWAACLYGRIGKSEKTLEHLNKFLYAYISRNGFHMNCDQKGGECWGDGDGSPRLFTLEGNFLLMEAVHEMLLQSWNGIIRVFPALPEDWKNLSFENLWTEGAFQVSAECKEGKLSQIEITSTQGNPLKLKSPWETVMVNGEAHQTSSAGYLEMETKLGETYIFGNATT